VSPNSPTENDALRRIAVLIPSRQPEPVLVELVAALLTAGLGPIVVVEDGITPAGQQICAQLISLGVQVLRHAVNLGKGRALKTGFNFLLSQRPDIGAVITADADGQHTPADILRVAEALAESLADSDSNSSAQPVLGVRLFRGAVPLRSRIGNALTRQIFALVTGAKLIDTQTGLRGLPLSLLPELMVLEGERYEYEMTMLAHLCRAGRKPIEVPIDTVYIDGNRSSHFDPLRDSMRIYFVLARFYLSSLLAAAIDLLVFTVCFSLTHSVLVSVVAGRVSSLVNFALNRKFVFHNQRSLAAGLWRYYLLALAVLAVSFGLIQTLTASLHWNVLAAKIIVDILLSMVSFALQRTFVFRRKQDTL